MTVAGTETEHIDGSPGPEVDVAEPPDESSPSTPSVPDATPPRFTLEEFEQCLEGRNNLRSCFRGIETPTTPEPEAPATPATPGRTITISDLARFVPSTATLAAEPQNVGVVGLPANFVSTAKAETVPGTVLGRALMIRFTPVTHRFDYGDGEQLDSTSAGTTWEASGQAQFTPTDTSHVYTEPGTYTATVTTTYGAEIDLGQGWQPIAGTLTGPPASQEIRVVTARTALVQNTCTERPGAPGC